ncbi:hypothetical protein DIPPA_23226 [Diplonema papillatum]|nr:hypothetical protein DIPPA_23226 [Diplonema papillatum]
MARDDASALSRWIVPDEDVDDGTFEGVMWRIPGHNARMRAAAALAKERSPLAAAQLARAKNDPRAVDAWLGIYTVVAAMAQGSADVLVALIRRSESTIVRARAVQALAKVDQVALYRVISDEATPAQLKGIGMKLLCLAGPPEDGRCDAFITVVLAEPTWGGYWQAVLLLQRLPRGEQTERVLEHWLPIVSKLASSVPKPKAARLHAYSSRADLEAVWQSVSIKHPRLFLRILEREAKFDFRYYRSSCQIAATHPDDVAELLLHAAPGDALASTSAQWYLVRPLVKRRPLKALEIVSGADTVTQLALHVAKKLLRMPGAAAVREPCLEVLGKLARKRVAGEDFAQVLGLMFNGGGYVSVRPAPVPKIRNDHCRCVRSCDDSRRLAAPARVVERFVPPLDLVLALGRACTDADCLVTYIEDLHPAAFRLYETRLSASELAKFYARDFDRWAGRRQTVSAAAVLKAVFASTKGSSRRRASLLEAFRSRLETVSAMLSEPNVAVADFKADAAIRSAVCAAIPRDQTVPWNRVEWLTLLPFGESEAVLRQVAASTKSPEARLSSLVALWTAAAGSGGGDGIARTLAFVSERVANEQEDVRCALLHAVLSASQLAPAQWVSIVARRGSGDTALGALRRLVEFTVRWGPGPWWTAWTQFAAGVAAFLLAGGIPPAGATSLRPEPAGGIPVAESIYPALAPSSHLNESEGIPVAGSIHPALALSPHLNVSEGIPAAAFSSHPNKPDGIPAGAPSSHHPNPSDGIPAALAAQPLWQLVESVWEGHPDGNALKQEFRMCTPVFSPGVDAGLRSRLLNAYGSVQERVVEMRAPIPGPVSRDGARAIQAELASDAAFKHYAKVPSSDWAAAASLSSAAAICHGCRWDVFTASAGPQLRLRRLLNAVPVPMSATAARLVLRLCLPAVYLVPCPSDPLVTIDCVVAQKKARPCFPQALTNPFPRSYLTYAPVRSLVCCAFRRLAGCDVVTGEGQDLAFQYLRGWCHNQNGTLVALSSAMRRCRVGTALAYEVCGWYIPEDDVLRECNGVLKAAAERDLRGTQMRWKWWHLGGVWSDIAVTVAGSIGVRGYGWFTKVSGLTALAVSQLASLPRYCAGSDALYRAAVATLSQRWAWNLASEAPGLIALAAHMQPIPPAAGCFGGAPRRRSRVAADPPCRRRLRFSRGAAAERVRKRRTVQYRALADAYATKPAGERGGFAGVALYHRCLEKASLTANDCAVVLEGMQDSLSRRAVPWEVRELASFLCRRWAKVWGAAANYNPHTDAVVLGCARWAEEVEPVFLKRFRSPAAKFEAEGYLQAQGSVRGRVEQLLDTAAAPAAFLESAAFENQVLRYRQDRLPALFLAAVRASKEAPDSSPLPLSCFTRAPCVDTSRTRYPAYETTNPNLAFVRPDIQRMIFDHFFDAAGVFGVEAGKRVVLPLNPAVAAALPCPRQLPAVDDPRHPFSDALRRTAEQRESVRARARRRQSLPAAQQPRLAADEAAGARAAAACLRLLLALCTHDCPARAVRVAAAHINRGVACKSAIPAAALMLRCLNTPDACAVLDAILGRPYTKAAARTQLIRTAIQLLGGYPEFAHALLKREWAVGGGSDVHSLVPSSSDGSWMLVDDGERGEGVTPGDGRRTEDDSEAVRQTPVSVKASIGAALLGSRLLASAADFFDAVRDSVEPIESAAIRLELYKALAGESETASLNVPCWPNAAPPGFVPMLMKELAVPSNERLSFVSNILTDKWAPHVAVDPASSLRESDVDSIRVAIEQAVPEARQLAAWLAVFLLQSGCEEAVLCILQSRQDSLLAEARNGGLAAVAASAELLDAVCSCESLASRQTAPSVIDRVVNLLLQSPATANNALLVAASSFLADASDGAFQRMVGALRVAGPWASGSLSAAIDSCKQNKPADTTAIAAFAAKHVESEGLEERFVSVCLARFCLLSDDAAVRSVLKCAADEMIAPEVFRFIAAVRVASAWGEQDANAASCAISTSCTSSASDSTS